MYKKQHLMVAAVSMGLLGASTAYAFENERLYMTAGAGVAWMQYDKIENVNGNGTSSLSADFKSYDKHTPMFNVGLGTMFNPVIGAELTYHYLRGHETHSVSQANNNLELKQDIQMWAVSLTGLAKMPINDQFFAFAKLGPGYTRVDRTIKNGGPSVAKPELIHALDKSFDNGGFGLAYGVGLQYDVNDRFGLRLEGLGIAGNEDANWGGVTGNIVLAF